MYTTKRTINTDDRILKILEDLQAGQQAIKADVTGLKTDVASIKDVQQKQGDVQQKQGGQIDLLVDTAGHINTALKAVATKHDVEVTVEATVQAAKSELGSKISDVEAKVLETRADILRLDSKVVKNIQSLNRRTTNLEDQSGIENPEKH